APALGHSTPPAAQAPGGTHAETLQPALLLLPVPRPAPPEIRPWPPAVPQSHAPPPPRTTVPTAAHTPPTPPGRRPVPPACDRSASAVSRYGRRWERWESDAMERPARALPPM